MHQRLIGLFLGIALLACTASAHAATTTFTWKYNELDWGTPANGRTGSWPYAEFNISFSKTFQGVDKTFGYCVEYDASIPEGRYSFTSKNISSLGQYQAAYLMDKYAYAGTNVQGLGSNDGNTITALQAAIWSVLGGTGNNNWTPITAPETITKLYSDMMGSLTTFTEVAHFSGLGLEKYVILSADIGTTDRQDIMVRTNPVPLPGAGLFLGAGLLGLVGLRRKIGA